MNIKLAICALIGHSRIVTMCFGYISCGRCKEQIGDTLAGADSAKGLVIIQHDCETCRDNYTKMTWRDKFLVRSPWSTEKEKRESIESLEALIAALEEKGEHRAANAFREDLEAEKRKEREQ